MQIDHRQAHLILTLLGISDESPIRPGTHTAEQANELIQALQRFVREEG